ncbi:MAG: hypothetical protein RL291_1393, partial [Pseudomonadota bacterium]
MLTRTTRGVRQLTAILCANLALLIAAAFDATATGPRWGKDYLPNVELLTQDGKKVRFYDDVMQGKIVVISFIFTN